MQAFTTREAASRLNISESTLRVWERKFAFPKSWRTANGRRLYRQADVMALAAALGEGLAIDSAVTVACDTHGADARALVAAAETFRADAADAVMDAALALRSVEQSLETVMMPALDTIVRRRSGTSAIWAFACAWSEGWLIGARRLAVRAGLGATILIGDATTPVDPWRPRVHALALCCARLGLRAVVLSAMAPDNPRELAAATQPAALIVAGSLGRSAAHWGYQMSRAAPGVPCLVYGGEGEEGASGHRVLPPSPAQAADSIAKGLRPLPRPHDESWPPL